MNPIEWEAWEYQWREKHPNWFGAVGAAAGVLTLGAIVFKNFLLAILVLISGFAVILYGGRRPEKINYAITQRGLRVGGQLFLYADLKSFWVNDHDEPSGGRIIFESKKLLMPHLVVPLADEVDPAAVREHLKNFLQEEKHEDTLADIIGDYLGW